MKTKTKPTQFKPYYKIVENITRKNPETNKKEALTHTTVIKKDTLLLARKSAWNYTVDRLLEIESLSSDNRIRAIQKDVARREKIARTDKAGVAGFDDYTYLDMHIALLIIHRLEYSVSKDAGTDKYDPEFKGVSLLKGDEVATTMYVVKEGKPGKETDVQVFSSQDKFLNTFGSLVESEILLKEL